jgi:hypothetical protein
MYIHTYVYKYQVIYVHMYTFRHIKLPFVERTLRDPPAEQSA